MRIRYRKIKKYVTDDVLFYMKWSYMFGILTGVILTVLVYVALK